MKTARYVLLDGSALEIEYDETAPCRICGLPVIDASMGGTDVCPYCDMGKERPDKRNPELYQIDEQA
jgi:rubrerythrin